MMKFVCVLLALSLSVVAHPNASTSSSVSNENIIYDKKGNRYLVRKMWAKATAYTPWDAIDKNSGFQDGYTSTMVNTQSGNPNDMYGIAVDPKDIPYNSYVYVPEYWEMLQNNKTSKPTRMTKADDTGGAMRQFKPYWKIIDGKRVFVEVLVDVRFRTHKGTKSWGKRYTEIVVVTPLN